MKRLIIIILLSLIGGNNSVYSQISFTDLPAEGAFIPRNTTTNKAVINVEGFVTDPAYTSFKVKVYRSGVLIKSYTSILKFLFGKASFKVPIELESGKHFFKLVYELNGSKNHSDSIDGILVGDVYLIQGQSNAVASSFQAFNPSYNDTFLRSFGTSHTNGNLVQSDTHWYPLNGSRSYNKGSVGQWGAVMAKSLLDSFGIPICILNGAVGGTRITQHVPTPGNSGNLYSIYGRLLYRVNKAKLEKNIRAILYYQGESDFGNAPLHDSLFRIVYKNWNKDFKGFNKLYVVQIRGGCGNPSYELLEVQRQFEFTLQKCQTVTANGLNGHDGCHFRFTNGYELLGQNIANLLARDFYGSKKENVNPPNIASCYYSNADQSEITLEMHSLNDSIYVDPNFHLLFRLEGNPPASITGGFIKNNRVVLTLSNSSCNIKGLSYFGLARSQPWVKNSTGMALLSFHNVPISTNRIKPDYKGCKNSTITLGEDSIPGCKYLWERISTGRIWRTAKINVKGDTSDTFSLIISFSNTSCSKFDTILVKMSPDPVQIPELGANITICKGDSISYSPNINGFSNFKWENSINLVYSWSYSTKIAENIKLSAFSNQGCIYSDSVQVKVSNPDVTLPSDFSICPNTDTLISVPNGYNSYFWNGIQGDSSYRTREGQLILKVSDNWDCTSMDTLKLFEFAKPKKLDANLTLCSGDIGYVVLPDDINKWYYSNIAQGDSIKISLPTSLPLTLIDTNNCKSFDTIRVYNRENPILNLGPDTGVCTNQHLVLDLPKGMKSYLWNGEKLDDNHVSINDTGTFVAVVYDSSNCFSSDTIAIQEYKYPSLTEFFDTILCIGQVWNVPLSSSNQYYFNEILATDTITFKNEESVLIKSISTFNCTAEKTIEIDFIDCDVSIVDSRSFNPITISPNPFYSEVSIQNSLPYKEDIIVINSQGKEVLTMTLEPGINVMNFDELSSGLYVVLYRNSTIKLIKK